MGDRVQRASRAPQERLGEVRLPARADAVGTSLRGERDAAVDVLLRQGRLGGRSGFASLPPRPSPDDRFLEPLLRARSCIAEKDPVPPLDDREACAFRARPAGGKQEPVLPDLRPNLHPPLPLPPDVGLVVVPPGQTRELPPVVPDEHALVADDGGDFRRPAGRECCLDLLVPGHAAFDHAHAVRFKRGRSPYTRRTRTGIVQP